MKIKMKVNLYCNECDSIIEHGGIDTFDGCGSICLIAGVRNIHYQVDETGALILLCKKCLAKRKNVKIIVGAHDETETYNNIYKVQSIRGN